jgi:hypothetical protein
VSHRARFVELDAELEVLGTAADGSTSRNWAWDDARHAQRAALVALDSGENVPRRMAEFEYAMNSLHASRRFDAEAARKRIGRHREELAGLDGKASQLARANARLVDVLALGAVAAAALGTYAAQVPAEYVPAWRWERGGEDSAVMYPRDRAEDPALEAMHRYRCAVVEAGIADAEGRLAGGERVCVCGAPWSRHGHRVGFVREDGDSRCPKTAEQLAAGVAPPGMYLAQTFVDAARPERIAS